MGFREISFVRDVKGICFGRRRMVWCGSCDNVGCSVVLGIYF